MTPVAKIIEVQASRTSDGTLCVVVTGQVPTSGWSNPRFAFHQILKDTSLQLIFLADPPHPATYVNPAFTNIIGMYCEKNAQNYPVVRIYYGNGEEHVSVQIEEAQLVGGEGGDLLPIPFKTTEIMERTSQETRQQARLIWRQSLGAFEDSHQPTGANCGGLFNWEMKKLRHDLFLVIEGPNQARMQECYQSAITSGIIAALVVAFTTGGSGLGAAITAATASLQECLGESFSVRIERRSEWITWCT